MMQKLLIIEDEHYTRKAIKAFIQNIKLDTKIVGESASVQEAKELIKTTQPDIVLLDINLKDGTGFEILEQLPDMNFSIIFITAYEEYALKALKVGTIDYVLKPIDENELKIALTKAIDHQQNTTQQLQVTEEHLKGKKDRIVLSLRESYQIIVLKDLVYCQSDSGYTTFHLADNTSYLTSKPIKEYEKLLPEDTFIRTHQSYIVNINFIEKLDKTRYLHLKSGKTIPVSQRKMDSVIDKLTS